MTDRNAQIFKLIGEKGVIRPRETEALGIPREYLQRLVEQKRITRIGRGLYTLPDTLPSEHDSLIEVAKRAPQGVICLLSALQFHHLTTQLPYEVWLAIEGTRWKPQIDYPRLRVVRFSGESYRYGIEIHQINNVSIQVYQAAKTVADCFKFRRKIGLDVALEALRETLREKRATVDEIWQAAKVCRVANVMKPYLEAM